MTKICCNCKKELDTSMFSKNCGHKDGLQSMCKSCQKEYDKQRSNSRKEYQKQYDAKRSETRKEYKRQYYKEYYRTHIEQIKEYERTHKHIRQAYDKTYKRNRFNVSMSRSIYEALKGNKAGRHWEDLVPYTLQQLKEHLEKQFTPEMSWDNYGSYWEIDHIIPRNLFNITDENCQDFKICWSLMNLRPLEKLANRCRPKDGKDIPKDIINNILYQNLN